MITKRMFAEWEPQRSILLCYPHPFGDWASIYDEVAACFREIALAVVNYQHLTLVIHPDQELPAWVEAVPTERISLFRLATNDSWARDFGVITCGREDGTLELNDFVFNGWGLKFAADKDNLISQQLEQLGAFPESHQVVLHNLVLEGGSIESDGQGTLLTTWKCLSSPNRNPAFAKAELETILKARLGANRILWLEHGDLEGDDTDGHIDTLARFCNPSTIAYVQCTDASDSHYADLLKMEGELENLRQANGKPYRLIPLPMVTPQYDEGDRLPATYANFLIMNETVLLPVYNAPTDQLAIDQLKVAFPERSITAIDCSALIKQHGSLHCVTMQFY